ncbi:CDP-glycerol glycerophosphotransferase family protein [Aequorivita capsosiphonis]|uniref:CDP-glycerol glycerophosphotransferase family protein n=1 Tax=Aequorivita capsosiphonis TaxID=487317 RepID=UPI0004192D01|nr:CDP-glycerol glycerophosphotransferase family protein [Aequorivita capsosiphonis]
MNFLLKFKSCTEYVVLPIWYLLDRFVKKKPSYWGFPVHFSDSTKFIENPRAVFEHIKKDVTLKKILFYRDSHNGFEIDDTVNYELVQLHSFRGLYLLMQCKVLFVSNAISWDFTLRWNNDTKYSIIRMDMQSRHVVNLWHGIPLKQILSLWNTDLRDRYNKISYRKYERENYSMIPASSKVDGYVMAAVFHPIDPKKVIPLGLPKNDFLLKTDVELPSYILNQLIKIRELKKSKKLILYAPTHRQTDAVKDAAYYNFSKEDIRSLKDFLKNNNAILGVRMHYLRKGVNRFPAEQLIDNEFIFDLGNRLIPEIAPCIIESDIIITDYSSLYLDAVYLNKPVFSFAYDLEHYSKHQDGLIYDMDFAFPGPIVKEFKKLIEALNKEIHNFNQCEAEKYKMIREMFFDTIDANNALRLIEKLKSELKIV